MPTRMSWRPGREGATLYVYPETQRADLGEPGENRPAAEAPDRSRAAGAQSQLKRLKRE
jgi:hypothetical protein